MNKTSIEWTTFSANPLKYRDAAGKVVWGCVHASPGCINCYAEAQAHRYRRGGPFNVATMSGLTPFLAEDELHKMLTAKRIDGVDVSGSMCFVGDMTDVFGEWVPDELLDRLFAVFYERRDVTWQVLTKRADRLPKYFARFSSAWPFSNVWIGVSVEDQPRYDARIGHLLRTPAAVRFLSVEPMLGSVDLRMGGMSIPEYSEHNPLPMIDWVIVGGESGPSARPMHPAWARSIRDQCQAAGVSFFFKQWGAWTPGVNVERTRGIVDTATRFDGRWIRERENLACTDSHIDDEPDLYRVGKKSAGRFLDGREWDEFPRAEEPA